MLHKYILTMLHKRLNSACKTISKSQLIYFFFSSPCLRRFASLSVADETYVGPLSIVSFRLFTEAYSSLFLSIIHLIDSPFVEF